ncbi:MAG: arginase family protein [Candidatus Cryptobacteroides sp.]
MKRPVVLNMSGAYDVEPLMVEKEFDLVDCRDIEGKDFICSGDAQEELSSRMGAYSPEGIHFLDSGNYHYLTKLWTDRLTVPFSLILIDHHTDIRHEAFDGVLTCGNWVRVMLDSNPKLRKVVIIGPTESQRSTIDPAYLSRVQFISEENLLTEEGCKAFFGEHLKEPVYISIDKDILGQGDAITDWDQGNVSLDDLERMLDIIFRNEKVIGMDICGEYSGANDLVKAQKAGLLNKKTNEEILKEVARVTLS